MAGKKKVTPAVKQDDPGKRAVQCAPLSRMAFETVEEFNEAADRYFLECDQEGELYGEAGLCLALSKYNRKGLNVTRRTLDSWYSGERAEWLQEAVHMAYLRIQNQIETDPRYREKGGMATRAIFLQKQDKFGGYKDRVEQKNDSTVHIVFGKGMDKSDFE